MFSRQTALSGRYYFNLFACIVYTRTWVLWFSKINKSISYSWIFGYKKEYLAQSEKGSWFDQPSKIGEEQVDKATGASSAHGASRKKVKGNLPKKSKISWEPPSKWEPLPSTSQDYSSSSDLENFEEDEASSKTWTIVERKLLNHHVLEQSASCRFCERCILKKWQAQSRPQSPLFFWSAPRTRTSGQIGFKVRKSRTSGYTAQNQQ